MIKTLKKIKNKNKIFTERISRNERFLTCIFMNASHAANVWRLATIVRVKVQALLAVLDYSGEHNISITTNPYGFFLLFSCYLLLRACSLTLDIALPKIRYIHLNHARKSVGNYCVFSLFFDSFLSLYFATKEKEKDISKKLFISNFFLLFLL